MPGASTSFELPGAPPLDGSEPLINTYSCGDNNVWVPWSVENVNVKCVSIGWQAAPSWVSAEVFTVRDDDFPAGSSQCAVTTVLTIDLLTDWNAAGLGVFADNLKNGPSMAPDDMDDRWFSLSCDGSSYLRVADNAYGAMHLSLIHI